MAEAPSTIDIANEITSIYDACELVGVEDLYDRGSSTMKTYCPFGDVSHLDGGDSKSFRVYSETNTAYCFACSKSYSPVSLIATARDISLIDAAEALLIHANYVPEDVDSQIQALLDEGERIFVNTDDLAEALKLHCAVIDGAWAERQFEPAVARKLSMCLALLDKVHTREDSKKWLDITKTAMTSILGDDDEREEV